MIRIEEIQGLLELYINNINIVRQLFMNTFGTKNPCKLYWQGLIERVGFLDSNNKIEYSIHGAGCTVEFENGDTVSFDFLEDDSVTFDLFKFELFIDERINTHKELKEQLKKIELYEEDKIWKLRNKTDYS